MKRQRHTCVNCGRGFHAFPTEIKIDRQLRIIALCKKKCAIQWHGENWKPGMFVPRVRENS